MMSRELNRLAVGLLLSFFLIGLTSAYWSVFRSEGLAAREDNPRRVQAEQRLRRGLIVDRHGIVLAATAPSADSSRQRRLYPYPYVNSAVGYFSYQYGSDGIESAFDDVLRGDYGLTDTWGDFYNDLLHRPQTGYDLRTTLDLSIQQQIARQMETRTGATVVVAVPSGEILALVSSPSFDGNVLDLNWRALSSDRRNTPLLNRAVRGIYQPGSVLNLILLTALIDGGQNITTSLNLDSSPLPVQLNGRQVTVACLTPPPESPTVSLQDAFAYSCPHIFAQTLGDGVSITAYETLIEQLGLLSAPPVFRLQTVIGNLPSPLLNGTDAGQATLLAGLGQGQLTVTPLQIARLIAAIANKGNAPPLHIADAYRLPDESEWQALNFTRREQPLMSAETADQLRRTLAYTAEISPLLQSANRADVSIRGYTLYGMVATAYTGPQQMNSWFLGFIEKEDGTAIVVVTILERTQSPEEAAIVAADAMQAVVVGLDN